MSVIAYGALPAPEPLPVEPWTGLGMTWTGWDGKVWDLTVPATGLFVTDDGLEGLGSPDYTHHTQQAPGIPGQWYRGSDTEPRKVFWPVLLWHDAGSREWVERDRAFWRTMKPDRPGVWTVQHPDGTRRTLAVRFDKAPDSLRHDPTRAGWAAYGISLVADQPYWAGAPVSMSWHTDASRGFLPSAEGEDYWVSRGSAFATAVMTNPGDVEAWPRWTIVGDSASASVGVGASRVEVPFAVPPGKAVVIDTDPTVQTAMFGDWDGKALSNAVDRTVDLGAADFAPIPAGEDRPLNIALTGTGAIRAELVPLYERAW